MAKFQAKKRKEQAATSAASGVSPQTSSPAESSFKAALVNFSFASPVAEDKTSDAMECVSDPQLSPENLRHQPDDLSTNILVQVSHNEEIIRQDTAILHNLFRKTSPYWKRFSRKNKIQLPD